MKQKIIFPLEVEMWYILPAIRKEIALGLIRKGFSQKEVAKIIGVTEATISHYKKEKRATGKLLDVDALKLVEVAVEKICEKPETYYTQANKLLQDVKRQGLICKIYDEKTSLSLKERPCFNCSEKSNICFENGVGVSVDKSIEEGLGVKN